MEKVWPQVLAIIIGCLGSLTCGTFLSWTSPFVVKISKDKENYDITEEEASWFTIISPVSMIVSSIVFYNLNDVLGRKPVLLLIAIPYTISWIVLAFAKSVWVFYVARFISGLSDGCLYLSLPMYIGEISTPSVRGTWGNGMTFFFYLGQFLIAVVGSYFNVQQTSFILICIPVIYFILLCFVPESPYFYIMKGKYEEAKTSLRRLKRKQDIERDFAQLKIDVERQMSESGTWMDLFTIGSNRKALYAGIFLRSSQQLSGIMTFMLYSQLIFEKAGGNMSSEISSIIFFAAVFVFNPIGGSILDKLGRKRAYTISTLFGGIVLFIQAIYFYIDSYEPQINIDFLNWIPVTGIVLFVAFYSIGLGIMPTLMLGELFSASIKSKGLSLLNVVFGVMIIVAARVFYVLNSIAGLFGPFLLYSLTCFLSTILSFFLVPETKGKSLEDIQQSLKSKKSNKMQSEGLNKTV